MGSQEWQQDAWGKRPVTYRTVLWETWSSFWSNTAISGISNAGNARHTVARLLWLGLSVVGLYFTTRDSVTVVQEYLKYPYTTQVNLLHKTQVEFPAVTVCNQNRVNCKKLLNEMLTQLSISAVSAESKGLVQLYNLSRCGIDGLSCPYAREVYFEYYSTRPQGVPTTLYEWDVCLDCPTILNDYIGSCYAHREAATPYEDFLWRMGDCYAKSSNSSSEYEAFPMIADSFHLIIRESLADCPCMSRDRNVIECRDFEGEFGDRPMWPENDEKDYQESTESQQATGISNSTPTYEYDFEVTSSKSFPATDATPRPERKDPADQLPDDSDVTTPSDDITSPRIAEPLRRKKREDRRPPPRDDDHEEYEDLFQNYQEMAPSERHDLQMNFLSLYMDMPPAIKRNIGYSFDELIKDCDFLGRKCYNESQFHHHLSPTYGNCYIFNGAGGVYTSLTGPTYSLSLVVDIWEKTYLPRRLTKKVGARVAVHRPKTLPLLDDDAIDVGPKLASSIAIKELNLHRLEKPYEANCTGSWETTKYQYINRTYANVYTITDCLRMCLQRLFVDRCSCFHALYPDNFVFDGKEYIRFFSTCNLTSTNPNSACVEKSLKLYSTNPGAANCGCNVACNETQYPSALSMANWPPEASEKDVKADYGKEETDDMMRVDVFFHTLNVDDVTQIGKYENVWGLVSSLGGALSLYMGISVFLLVEVLEFLIYLVVNSCMYVVGGYETQTEVRPATPPSPTPSDVVFVRRLYGAFGTKVPKSYGK